MKILSGLLGVILLVVILCFALSNPDQVTVGLWPFDAAVHWPLYMVGLLPLLAGLFVGGLWGWLASVPHRLRARRLGKERDALHDKITDLQRSALVQQTHAPKKKLWRFGL